MKVVSFFALLCFLLACHSKDGSSNQNKNLQTTGVVTFSHFFSYSYDNHVYEDSVIGFKKGLIKNVPKRSVITFDENRTVLSELSLLKDSVPKRIVLLNTTYCSYFKSLDAIDLIKGIAALETLKNDTSIVNKGILNVGEQGVLNVEKIQSLKPDLVVCSSFQLKDLGMIDCPLLVVNEFWENHPLARSEWVKVFALIVGKKDLGDNIFKTLVDEYRQDEHKTKTEHSIINIQLYSSQYFVPGCEALLNRFLTDAGYRVLCEQGSKSKSVELSKESVVSSARKVDFLLYFDWSNTNKTHQQVLEALKIEDHFSGDIIYCNTRLNGYFDETVMTPQLILKELSMMKAGTHIDFNNDENNIGKYFSVLKQ